MMSKQKAISATPMNKTAPHTTNGGIRYVSPIIGIATKLSTAVKANCTMARFMASTCGAKRLIQIICKAKATEQPSSNISPNPNQRANRVAEGQEGKWTTDLDGIFDDQEGTTPDHRHQY